MTPLLTSSTKENALYKYAFDIRHFTVLITAAPLYLRTSWRYKNLVFS